MEFRVCLCVLLFIATVTAIEDSLTVMPYSFSSTSSVNSTIPSISATSTPAIPSSATSNGSFTLAPLSSTFMPTHTISPTVTPPPVLNNGCYSVNRTNTIKPCVLLCVKQPIRLISSITDEKGKNYNVTIAIPGSNSVKVDGYCPKFINGNFDRSTLNFSWNISSGINCTLELTFVLNQKANGGNLGAQDVWFLETATYDYHSASLEFQNSVNLTNGTETETITSDVRRAYTCDKPHLFFLNNPIVPNGTVTIINITDYTIQPFALNLTGNSFTFLDTCEPGGIPLFVPIIVAGILAVFVLILLFLYVIGRFRTKKKVQYERLS